MSEEKAEKKKSKNAKRARKWVWCAAIVIVIGAIICCLLWKASLWEFQTVDEQLAAIEAARAIPDEENAAIIYNQLLEDYDESSLSPDFLDEDLDNLTRSEPWLSKDYPELAEWLKDQQDTISKLLQASKKEKCRFAIIIDIQQMPVQMDRLSAMRRWAFLLIRAANNDIAEGRIDDALEKYLCLNQMGNHLHQQPLLIEYLVAMAIEAVALNQTVVFLVEGNADETHLRKIETLPLHTEDDWTAVLEEVLPTEELVEQKIKEKWGLLDRLRYEFGYGLFAGMKDSGHDRIREIYQRKLSTSRGLHILVVLRRYRNEHGHWPESLDQIKSSLPQEILTDPHNNGPFVYKLTDNAFKLYSKGKNNVDEDGRYRDPQDDWPIWPQSSRKTKNEKADTAQSNTQKEVVK